jgi:hypothetical protein
MTTDLGIDHLGRNGLLRGRCLCGDQDGHQVNQRRVEGAEDPIGQFDQHDVNALVDQGRRHLQPEIVGADCRARSISPASSRPRRLIASSSVRTPNARGWSRPWIDGRVGVPSAVTAAC